MKIGILGATGPTGLCIVEQAVAMGHEVDCFVRTPSKLGGQPKAKATQGTLSDSKALTAWASKQDAVLVALGHKQLGQSLKARLGLGTYPEPLFISQTVELLLRVAAEGKTLKKLVYCSAYGTQETENDLPWVFGKVLKPLLLSFSYADHERSEKLFEASKSDWVVARPGMLTNGPKTGVYQCADRFKGKTMKISRADTAHFMLRAVTEKGFTHGKWGLGY
jgi:uncharacterized protein YbjT (DUF2867 family)